MTRQITILILLVFTLQACESTSEKTTTHPSVFFVKDYKKEFKYKDILKFPRSGIKDLNGSESFHEIHKPITGDLAYRVFQDNEYVSDTINEWTKVLYSIQNHKGHQGILVGGMDDDWVNKLMYYSYSKDGKLISKLTLYGHGGDGGYTTETYGEFRDSVYIRTTVNCELSNEESHDVVCDSVTQKFILHFDGKFEEIKK